VSLVDVLVGGGLTLVGSMGGQMYAARRERERDVAADRARADDRRRADLLEAQLTVSTLFAETQLSKTQDRNGRAWADSLGRLLNVAQRLEPASLRKSLTDYAYGLVDSVRTRKPGDPPPPEPPMLLEIVQLLGKELRSLDEAAPETVEGRSRWRRSPRL
jgi:hypothetical protein